MVGRVSDYLGKPHAFDCDCSVCWVNVQFPVPAYQPCPDCMPPGNPFQAAGGRCLVKKKVLCSFHRPVDRPERYWSLVSETSTYTPYLPMGVFQ